MKRQIYAFWKSFFVRVYDRPAKSTPTFVNANHDHVNRVSTIMIMLLFTDFVKLLGIEADNKLKFNKNVKMLGSKVNKKISAFSRLNTYIAKEQVLKICNVVILSNFNYCPLIWLCCKKVYRKRFTVHTLRILCKEYECPFETLLTRIVSFCMRVRNL